jgi:quercetin dioxygenase-like cupin family protein
MADIVWVKEVTPDVLRPVEGLQGRWGRLVQASAENGGMIFGLGELLPGDVAGWHEHPDPEIFFVLEGAGEALWRLNGTERQAPLRPGVAFFKIGGIPHQMRNTGTGPLRGVYFKIAKA